MDGISCFDFFCDTDDLITRNCEEDSCAGGACMTRSYQEKYGACGGP